MLLLHKIFLGAQPYRVHTTATLAAPMFRATTAPTLRYRFFVLGRGIFLMKTSAGRKCECLEKHSMHEILTVLTPTKHGLTVRCRQLPVRSCKSIDYYQNLLENLRTVQAYIKFKPHKQFGNHIKKMQPSLKEARFCAFLLRILYSRQRYRQRPISLCDVIVNPQKEKQCLISVT